MSNVRDLPELQKARALWGKHRLTEALWLFHRTARQYPDHPLALADAARAMGSFYQFRRAESLLGRLVMLADGNPAWLHLAAQSYRLIRRPIQARQWFERTALLPGAPADTSLELALLYERLGRWDEAAEQIATRLHRLPTDGEARVVRARLIARRGEVSEAERMLRGLSLQKSLFWLTRMRAYAELATVLERMNAYDDAWQAMAGAKMVARDHAREPRQHRDYIMAPLDRIAATVTASHLRRWREEAESLSSNSVALLTGLPRSGTTLVERMLEAHSQLATLDECDLFPRWILPTLLRGRPIHEVTLDDLDQLPSWLTARRQRQYERRLRACSGADEPGRLLIDKNPSLLPLIPFFKRMMPHGKLIVALRDPRDVLVSCWMTFFPLNDFSIDFLDLKTAAARVEHDLRLWLRLREEWPEGWVECRYEELVQRPRDELTRVLHELGVEWEDSQLNYHERKMNAPLQSPSYERVMHAPDERSVGRWRKYERQIAPVLPVLEAVCDRCGYRDSES